MNQRCIYCGTRDATTRDHVPPKSFFAKPLPSDLITVPCCEVCNNAYGKDDERVRNLLTSINATENHPAIQTQIAAKRDRSYKRPKGRSNFEHILSSVVLVGDRLAFDLGQPVMDRFIERITRALLYHKNGTEYVSGDIDWRMAPDHSALPSNLRDFLRSRKPTTIGNGEFTYVGYVWPGRAHSLWLLNFYHGVEFMALMRESNQ